jgi:hypothetical protein
MATCVSLNHARFAEDVRQGLHDEGAKKAGRAEAGPWPAASTRHAIAGKQPGASPEAYPHAC